MTTIPLHKISRKKSQFGKKPTKNRDLENNPHHQTHHHQRIHIRGQSNRVLHFHTDLIGSKKTESKRKNQKIIQKNSHHKKKIAPSYNPGRIFLFILV